MTNDYVMMGVEILTISKIHYYQSISRLKISLSANFHVLSTFGSLVIKLGYVSPRCNDDVMLGVKILEISKIHYHQSIQRPKISLNANFHASITSGSLVIKLLKL